MELADISKLIIEQGKLDANIASNHHVDYPSTFSRRVLALLVEIGEFANTTRCFKYWSNKGMESKEVVLDEYADGLHFYLSLAICSNVKKMIYEVHKPLNDLTDQFHTIYHLICLYKDNPNEETFVKAFEAFLNCLPLIGYSWLDLEEAYYKKLKINYQRQETNY